jgi:hypothetical protein
LFVSFFGGGDVFALDSNERYFRSRNPALPQDSHSLRGSARDLWTVHELKFNVNVRFLWWIPSHACQDLQCRWGRVGKAKCSPVHVYWPGASKQQITADNQSLHLWHTHYSGTTIIPPCSSSVWLFTERWIIFDWSNLDIGLFKAFAQVRNLVSSCKEEWRLKVFENKVEKMFGPERGNEIEGILMKH